MKIIKKISKSLTPKEQYLEKYGKHFTIKLANFASEQMVRIRIQKLIGNLLFKFN